MKLQQEQACTLAGKEAKNKPFNRRISNKKQGTTSPATPSMQ